MPALRERRDEVPTLTDFFVARYARKYNRPGRPISEQLRELFVQYEWPGNIRELENMIKRIVILQDEQLVVREIQRNMERAAAVPAVAIAAQMPALARRRSGVRRQWAPSADRSLPVCPKLIRTRPGTNQKRRKKAAVRSPRWPRPPR